MKSAKTQMEFKKAYTKFVNSDYTKKDNQKFKKAYAKFLGSMA